MRRGVIKWLVRALPLVVAAAIAVASCYIAVSYGCEYHELLGQTGSVHALSKKPALPAGGRIRVKVRSIMIDNGRVTYRTWNATYGSSASDEYDKHFPSGPPRHSEWTLRFYRRYLPWVWELPYEMHWGYGESHFKESSPDGTSRAGTLVSVAWPWVIAIAGLPLLFAILRGLWIARHGQHSGHCRQCGYDLRATPDRCPECGMRGQGS